MFPLLLSDTNSKADLADVVTIPDIEKKWKELGAVLNISSKQLAEIEAKHKKPIKCKREMFRVAVKSEVTWKQIIMGLNKIGMGSTIREVCTMFDIPLNGISKYVTSTIVSSVSYSLNIYLVNSLWGL